MISINQSVKTRDAQARWGTPTDRCLRCDGRPTTPVLCNAELNDGIEWPVHSLILSFHDLRGLPLRRLPSIEPRSMIFVSVS